MTAPLLNQVVAAFALHALWQVPVVGLTAWVALRVGRARAHAAHAVWLATLVLCVAAPVAATWQGYVEARSQAEVSDVSISYGASDATVAPLRREPAWKRVLHRHVSLSHGITPFAWTLSPWIARLLAMAYAACLGLALCKLLWSLAAARRLVQSSSAQVPTFVLQAVARQAAAMGCTAPRTAVSAEIASPLLVGTLRPTLLLPAADVSVMSTMDLHAVLAHELVHIRRHDPVSNSVCSWLLLPVRFHPVARWISSRVRQTREMACDAEAAEWMGSSLRYADALLRVAERSAHMAATPNAVGLGLFDGARNPAISVRDRNSHVSTRPAAVGLELFGAAGAMEERMNMMLSQPRASHRSTRLFRSLAAAAIAATGIITAWMMQVQPAFAAQEVQTAEQVKGSTQDDNAPALIGGYAAQRQLQQADQRLDRAKGNAGTDEDRNRIAAAQQVIHLAQRELASETQPTSADPRIALEEQDLQGSKADLRLKALDAAQQAALAKVQAQMASPEFKAHLEALRKNAEATRLKVESPEFKARLEALRKNGEAARLKVESPEFKARLEAMKKNTEAMRKNAEAMQLRMQSPEFQARLRKQEEDAKRMTDVVNSPEFQARIARQLADADALLAKNTFPSSVFETPHGAEGPRKVSSETMAGSILTKPVPVYPQSAKDAKIQGEVLLHAIINEEGSVEQLSVIHSPDDALSKSAMDAVRQWKYKPYLLNGKPTAVDTTITVHYSFAG